MIIFSPPVGAVGRAKDDTLVSLAAYRGHRIKRSWRSKRYVGHLVVALAPIGGATVHVSMEERIYRESQAATADKKGTQLDSPKFVGSVPIRRIAS